MVSEEKTEGVIVEGTKHPLTFNMSDTEESLHKCFKDFIDVLSDPNDLTDKVKDVIVSHSKPIHFHFITRNAYVTYKGIKIPTKELHNQSKNKFINRCVLKNVTPVSVTTEDLGDYKMGIDIKLRYNA